MPARAGSERSESVRLVFVLANPVVLRARILTDWHTHGNMPAGELSRYNFSVEDIDAIRDTWAAIANRRPTLFFGSYVETASGFIRFFPVGVPIVNGNPSALIQTIRKGKTFAEETK